MQKPLLLIILVVFAMFFAVTGDWHNNHAMAEPRCPESTNAIKVVPLQVGRDSWGLAMIDIEGKKLWVYEINRDGGHSKLRLLAARDWQYDQQLTDYNTGEPKPYQVKEILEKFGNEKNSDFE